MCDIESLLIPFFAEIKESMKEIRFCKLGYLGITVLTGNLMQELKSSVDFASRTVLWDFGNRKAIKVFFDLL